MTGVADALARAQSLLDFGRPQEALDLMAGVDVDGLEPSLAREVQTLGARALEACGDLDGALAVWEALYSADLAGGCPREAAVAAMNVTVLLLELGAAAASTQFADAAVATLAQAGAAGTDEHVRLAVTAVWVLVERGHLMAAAHDISELMLSTDKTGSRLAQGSARWNASVVAWHLGQLDRALDLARSATDLLEGVGSPRDLPRLGLHTAEVQVARGVVGAPAALELLAGVIDDLGAVSVVEEARCWRERAKAHLLLGDVTPALAAIRVAVDRLDGAVIPDLCLAYVVWGDVCVAAGDAAGGLEKYRWAAERLSMMGMGWQAIVAMRKLGDRLVERGDFETAVRVFTAAVETEQALSQPARSPRAAVQVGRRANVTTAVGA